MKKSIVSTLCLVMITTIAFMSCQNEDEVITEEVNVEFQNTSRSNENSNDIIWSYIMDIRFSRICDTGGGVCFNEGDDIWDYGPLVSGPPTPADVNSLDRNDDHEIGGMFLGLTNDKIHIIFAEDVEDEFLFIDEDVTLPEDLFSELEGYPITIKAGEYPISFDRYEFGETYVEIHDLGLAPIFAVTGCDVNFVKDIIDSDPSNGTETFKLSLHWFAYNQLANNQTNAYLFVRPVYFSSTIELIPFNQILPNNGINNNEVTFSRVTHWNLPYYEMVVVFDNDPTYPTTVPSLSSTAINTWFNSKVNGYTYCNSDL